MWAKQSSALVDFLFATFEFILTSEDTLIICFQIKNQNQTFQTKGKQNYHETIIESYNVNNHELIL